MIVGEMASGSKPMKRGAFRAGSAKVGTMSFEDFDHFASQSRAWAVGYPMKRGRSQGIASIWVNVVVRKECFRCVVSSKSHHQVKGWCIW